MYKQVVESGKTLAFNFKTILVFFSTEAVDIRKRYIREYALNLSSEIKDHW